MTAVPLTFDEITVDWLNQSLHESGVLKGQQAINKFQIEPVGAGLGYLSFLYRIRPVYNSQDAALPATMIVKFPSTEAGSRMSGNGLRAYERESLFYRHCSEDSPMLPPRHYYSYSDPVVDEHILVMEDLDGARFVNQVDGVQPDDAIACFRAMAAHHAKYWNRTDDFDWLPLFSEYGDLYKPLMMSGAPIWAANWSEYLVPTYTDNIDKGVEKYPAIAQRLQALPTTLAHCDPRIENICFAGASPRFYDWQLTARGPAAYDVMYFLQQSMDVAVRQQCQDELFANYLEVLAEHRISYTKAQLLDDIGLAACTIWGFMAMLGNFVLPGEINNKLVPVTTPRYMAMIEDFGAVDKLNQF